MAQTSSSHPADLRPVHILVGGLIAGLCVNLVDVPNSALLVSPEWMRILAGQGITPSVPLIGCFFTVLHFVYGVPLVLVYAWGLPRFGTGVQAALFSALPLLVTNRLFGLGAVVMGQMPLGIYARFSWSLVLGTLLGAIAGARVHDLLGRRASTATAA